MNAASWRWVMVLSGALGAYCAYCCGTAGATIEKRNPVDASSAAANVTVTPTTTPAANSPAMYHGAVVAANSVAVTPPQEGRLISIPVRMGDSVRAGEVLARLDAELQQSQLDIALASEQTAAAEQRKAESELRISTALLLRSQSKFDAGVMAGEDLVRAEAGKDLADSSLAIARARLVERHARLRAAQTELERTIIRAPLDGIVVGRYVDVGNRVAPQTILFRLIGGGPNFLRFGVPPEVATRLACGSKVAAHVGNSIIEAEVKRVASEIDPATGVVAIEAAFLADERQILSGEAAVVEIIESATP